MFKPYSCGEHLDTEVEINSAGGYMIAHVFRFAQADSNLRQSHPDWSRESHKPADARPFQDFFREIKPFVPCIASVHHWTYLGSEAAAEGGLALKGREHSKIQTSHWACEVANASSNSYMGIRGTVQMGFSLWRLKQRLCASQMFLSSLLTLPSVHLILKMDGDGVEMGNEIKSQFWL